jgi:geranylgeranyl diphosphate synthase type 3
MYNLHYRLDDMVGNTFLRRGVPAAHAVYGVASTICTAMYAIFVSLQRALVTNQPEMIKLYTEMMLESWRGRAI